MKLHHWTTILLTVCVFGCQAPAPTPQPAPAVATMDDLARIRASYKSQNPNVDVGMVDDVLTEKNLAQVNEVNAADFKEGDTVCFIDVATNPIVCGQVVRIVDGHLDVKYEVPSGDHRAPMKGDLAVAFK
jgi:hypothetical protein